MSLPMDATRRPPMTLPAECPACWYNLRRHMLRQGLAEAWVPTCPHCRASIVEF